MTDDQYKRLLQGYLDLKATVSELALAVRSIKPCPHANRVADGEPASSAAPRSFDVTIADIRDDIDAKPLPPSIADLIDPDNGDAPTARRIPVDRERD